MKRIVKSFHVPVLSLLLMLVVAPLSTLAQEATPATSLENLGLETFNVTISADGIEASTDVEAGPVLLVVHNQTEGFAFVDIVQLPDGVSADEYLTAASSEGAMPEWGSEIVIAGGVTVAPGSSSQVGLVLQAGEYTVAGFSETPLPVSSVPLTVTGEATAESADAVPADLSVDMGHYTFDIPDTIVAGSQVWRVTNSHEGVLHHVVVVQTDRLYTTDEVLEGIIADFSGTPVADGFSLFNLPEEDAASSPVISSGQTIWIEANLEPGFYVAICFLPDPGDETPHFLSGMIDTFEAVAD